MDIHIKKGQVTNKGGFLSGGQNTTALTLEVKVSLSEQDKHLIEKYYEPNISYSGPPGKMEAIIAWYDGPVKATSGTKTMSIKVHNGKLSKFHLTAQADGYDVGTLQQFEEATIRALVNNLGHLETLSEWEGERILTSEEELPSGKTLPSKESSKT